MKTMKDIRKKSTKDLRTLLHKTREALREFRFKSAGSHARNVKEGARAKRLIARILTELRTRNDA